MDGEEYQRIMQILSNPQASFEDRIKASEELEKMIERSNRDMRAQHGLPEEEEEEPPKNKKASAKNDTEDQFAVLEKEMMRKLEESMEKRRAMGDPIEDDDDPKNMPDMSKMFAGGMPDISKMMSGLGMQGMPDISKMMESMGAGGMPDMSKIMAGMGGGGGMPDISKMMASMGAGGMPDISKMMGSMGADGMPDISKMFSSGGSEQEDEDDDPTGALDAGGALKIAEKYYNAHKKLVAGNDANELSAKAGSVKFDGGAADAKRADALCDDATSYMYDDNFNIAAAAAAVAWAPANARPAGVLASQIRQSPSVTFKSKATDAERLIRYSLSINSKDAELYSALAMILFDKGDKEGAKEAMDMSLKLQQ